MTVLPSPCSPTRHKPSDVKIPIEDCGLLAGSDSDCEKVDRPDSLSLPPKTDKATAYSKTLNDSKKIWRIFCFIAVSLLLLIILLNGLSVGLGMIDLLK